MKLTPCKLLRRKELKNMRRPERRTVCAADSGSKIWNLSTNKKFLPE
jgi:hypothetical protein